MSRVLLGFLFFVIVFSVLFGIIGLAEHYLGYGWGFLIALLPAYFIMMYVLGDIIVYFKTKKE